MYIFLIIILVMIIGYYLLKRFWPVIIRFALKKMQQRMQRKYEQAQGPQQNNSGKRSRQKQKNDTDHLGEYVDYEELD